MARRHSNEGDDPTSKALGRIADVLDLEFQAREQERFETARNRSREGIALVVIAITLILTALAYTNSASAIAQALQPLHDYGTIAAAIFTVFVAMAYRAFQVGLIPVEIIVAVGLGEMAVAEMTFWSAPAVRGSAIGSLIPVAFVFVATVIVLATQPHVNSWVAYVLSTAVVIAMLWFANLLVIASHGSEWLRISFAGQPLLIVDSSFPILIVIDSVFSVAVGSVFVLSCSQRDRLKRLLSHSIERLGIQGKLTSFRASLAEDFDEPEDKEALALLSNSLRTMAHRAMAYSHLEPALQPVATWLRLETDDFEIVALLTVGLTLLAFLLVANNNFLGGFAHWLP